MHPLATLLSLATGQHIGPLAVQVQQRLQDPWLAVHSQAIRRDDLSAADSPLLYDRDVTVDVLVTWLNNVERLGPLPPVVAAGMRDSRVLETQVLELTTVAEGLHRRLDPNKTRYSLETGKAVREAAATAAEAVHPGAGRIVTSFLQHIHEIGYGDRLLALGNMATPFMPEVTGVLTRWKKAVYQSRNDFAHRATSGWTSDAAFDQYITVAWSMKWLLRGILLHTAGIPDDVLALRFRAHQPYKLFLAQARMWQPATYPAE